ncbi:MAG TPA: hypothetical protein VMW27_05460 [Thermoanaerobaculia bacterium]|nr:hypothetical protein [Thermoanaerobaculia bacterium]
MKKAVKKLQLTRESLHVLDRIEMVRGGVGADTDMQNSCGSVCYTDKGCGGQTILTQAG